MTRKRPARGGKRCACGKTLFGRNDRLSVQLAAARTGFRMYWDPVCRQWHLTSARARGR